MLLFISRQLSSVFTLLALFLLLTSLSPASTVKIPEDQPAISVDIPDSWKPEQTDKGIACESPDKVATVFLEVTSTKGQDALIERTGERTFKTDDRHTREPVSTGVHSRFSVSIDYQLLANGGALL